MIVNSFLNIQQFAQNNTHIFVHKAYTILIILLIEFKREADSLPYNRTSSVGEDIILPKNEILFNSRRTHYVKNKKDLSLKVFEG